MDMKNVKNARCANYIQIDNIVRQIQATKEIIILPSKQAFEKYNWTRKYFIEKPQEGYFVWVKGLINNFNFSQNLFFINKSKFCAINTSLC